VNFERPVILQPAKTFEKTTNSYLFKDSSDSPAV